MDKNRARNLYKRLEEKMTTKTFLRNTGLSKKAVITFLSKYNWKLICQEFATLPEITCMDVYEKTKVAVNSLFEEPVEGRLKDCFEGTLNSIFPQGIEHIVEGENKYKDKNTEKQKKKPEQGRLFFYTILTIILEFDRENSPFSPTLDMELLSREEYRKFPSAGEYEKLIGHCDEKHLYAFMRISSEITPFNTWGHVCGVHFVAMHVSKQMERAGVPIDLALTSGAAASHDIGKFGVKSHEVNRIPYLHYYYTNRSMARGGMPLIAHIASNHSTWDLELENMSVESLALIYADFRVKSSRGADGKEIVNFYSLKDVFQVILSKLDNVDEEKKSRYIRVYQKLYDFEKYMESLGVSTNLEVSNTTKIKDKDPALLSSMEATERLKYLAIEHNIKVMSRFNSEIAFANLLEDARSEKQWKNIRAYMNTLQEYFTYMTQKQKQMTIGFLFDLLAHREGDIRRQAAALIGAIIASYDEKYRKELPEGVTVDFLVNHSKGEILWKEHLQRVIHPDLKTTDQQCRWIGYTLIITLQSLLQRSTIEQNKKYLQDVYELFEEISEDNEAVFVILNALLAVPLELYTSEDIKKVLEFALHSFQIDKLETQVAVLRLVKELLYERQDIKIDGELLGRVGAMTDTDLGIDESASIVFLKYKIKKAIGFTEEETYKYREMLYEKVEATSEIFRENLKVGTSWVIKAVNIELLLHQLKYGGRQEVFYIAAHLSNLLKVSERVTVRHSAGAALIEVFKHLNRDQKNEIVVELAKGLEIGEYQFSKYIPEYLGNLALTLHPSELNETIQDLSSLLESGNDRVASVTLDTLGQILKNYPCYRESFEESEEEYQGRKTKILGMIMRGMADYHQVVSQEAFMVIGQHIFAERQLSLRDRFEIFRVIFKKMLTLAQETHESQLTFYNNAAALNHIYRFISDYKFYCGEIQISENKKVAFFPGTFDPFSRSHKGIVRTIRDLGYEVYLALDEFSWSKRTQPRKIRSRIITMSVADEKDIYLFPDDEPVNISNPQDLRNLKKLWEGKELYIVVGSDVVTNASSYAMTPAQDTIHSLNHIIFRRDSIEQGETSKGEDIYALRKEEITGNVVELTLPTHLEDISSSRIRDNIDSNRDISSLIDPIVQNYIYDLSLYMRAPQYKQVMSIKELRVNSQEVDQDKYTTLSDSSRNNQIIGTTKAVQVVTANLYEEFLDPDISAYIREEALGKILVMKSIWISQEAREENLHQIILTETLTKALAEDFTYAVYHPDKDSEFTPQIREVLELQGFKEIVIGKRKTGIYAVDMKNPVVVFQNMDTVLKEPFDSNIAINKILEKTHQRMQKSLTGLYPNSLILSINSHVMYHKLIGKVSKVNGVPSYPLKERKLGASMCVPFGRIMKTTVFPNTVTKTLHTEKSFSPNLDSFTIKEYPFYASITDQIKTIKSFDRSVILVDDLLHKGYRMKSLDPILNHHKIKVDKLVVGILSGRGKDLMTVQNRDVDSVYFLPNLRVWFVESSLYPFMGGDGVKRDTDNVDEAFIAINLIMPYVVPSFLDDVDRQGIFDFSKICLENARDIFKVLEEEYQNLFGRKLTLARLSEAVLFPRVPDVGLCLDYDKTIAASQYIENDIERLLRLKGMCDK